MHYYINVLKKYGIFKGRATRSEYWYFVLFNTIAGIILGIISKIIGDQKNILGNIYGLALFVPTLAVTIRRLHDIGRTGWWILFFILIFFASGIFLFPLLIVDLFTSSFFLLLLIPIAIFIWSTVWMCTDSKPGDNKYGPNPKMISTPTVEPVSPASTPAQ